jgi:hypothetical protein
MRALPFFLFWFVCNAHNFFLCRFDTPPCRILSRSGAPGRLAQSYPPSEGMRQEGSENRTPKDSLIFY